MLVFTLCALLALASVHGSLGNVIRESESESVSLEVSNEESNSVESSSVESDESALFHPNTRRVYCNREKNNLRAQQNWNKRCSTCRRNARNTPVCKRYDNYKPHYGLNRASLRRHLNQLIKRYRSLQRHMKDINYARRRLDADMKRLRNRNNALHRQLRNYINRRNYWRRRKSRYQVNRHNFLIKRQRSWIQDNQRAINQMKALLNHNSNAKLHIRRAMANNAAAQRRVRAIMARKRWNRPPRPVLRDRCYRRIARCQGTCWNAWVHWSNRHYYGHLCRVRRMICSRKRTYNNAWRNWERNCTNCKNRMKKHPFYRFARLLGCRSQCGHARLYHMLYNFYRPRCR